MKYHYPAKYNDILEVQSRITDVSSVKIIFETTIKNQQGRLCVSGDVKLACISPEGKARRIPDDIISAVA